MRGYALPFRAPLSLITFIGGSAQPQGATGAAPLDAACTSLNHKATARAAEAQFAEAEDMLSAVLANVDRRDHVCAGPIMNNIAALLLASGRLPEAEAMAGRSVHTFEETFPPDDLVLLRPLQILAATQFEQGKTWRAREASRECRRSHHTTGGPRVGERLGGIAVGS